MSAKSKNISKKQEDEDDEVSVEEEPDEENLQDDFPVGEDLNDDPENEDYNPLDVDGDEVEGVEGEEGVEEGDTKDPILIKPKGVSNHDQEMDESIEGEDNGIIDYDQAIQDEKRNQEEAEMFAQKLKWDHHDYDQYEKFESKEKNDDDVDDDDEEVSNEDPTKLDENDPTDISDLKSNIVQDPEYHTDEDVKDSKKNDPKHQVFQTASERLALAEKLATHGPKPLQVGLPGGSVVSSQSKMVIELKDMEQKIADIPPVLSEIEIGFVQKEVFRHPIAVISSKMIPGMLQHKPVSQKVDEYLKLLLLRRGYQVVEHKPESLAYQNFNGIPNSKFFLGIPHFHGEKKDCSPLYFAKFSKLGFASINTLKFPGKHIFFVFDTITSKGRDILHKLEFKSSKKPSPQLLDELNLPEPTLQMNNPFYNSNDTKETETPKDNSIEKSNDTSDETLEAGGSVNSNENLSSGDFATSNEKSPEMDSESNGEDSAMETKSKTKSKTKTKKTKTKTKKTDNKKEKKTKEKKPKEKKPKEKKPKKENLSCDPWFDHYIDPSTQQIIQQTTIEKCPTVKVESLASQYFTFDLLASCYFKNTKMTTIPPEEIPSLVQKLYISSTLNFAKISNTEPISRYMGWNVYDLILIE